MKRFGSVFLIVFLILAQVLPQTALADNAGTLPAPGGFSVSIEDSHVLINVDGAETGQYIRIERSTDSGDFKVIATLSPGITSFKDHSVSNGHVYKYRARRHSSKNSSPYTREIEVIFLRPLYLSITGVYSDQINLEWDYPELLIPRTVTYETIVERKADGKSGWTEIYTAPYYQRELRDHGLDPDTIYYYRIRTRYSENQYSRYIPATSGVYRRTTISLTTPLTGFAITDRQIRLDWDREAVEGHTVYVQRQDSFGDYETIFFSTTADHYIDSSDVIFPGEEYTYRLFLRSSKGSISAYSEPVTIKTETIPGPSQLKASPAAHGRIALTWEYPYDVESGFEIWRKEQNGIWQKVDEVGRNIHTWTDYSSLTDMSYRYRVRAIRGESAFSDFAVSDLIDNAEPFMPGELLFLPMESSMLIGSNEPAPEGVRYTLEVRTDINQPWSDYSLGQTGRTLLVFFFPADGKEYDFRIRSENQGNIIHGPVYRLHGSVPEAPTGLRVASMGSNQVLLTWNDISKTEDGYRIYRIQDQKRILVGTTEKDATSFIDTKAVPGSTVRYEVCAFNTRGESTGISIDVSVQQKAVFKDLEGFSWCTDAVNALASSGAIAQNPDGLFHPGANITRAQFITILMKSFDIMPESEFLFSVKDVAPGSWYYPYMMTAVKLGIVIPDENRNAGPLNPVTTADMAIFMNRLLTARNRALDSISISYLDRFTDGYLVGENLKGIISSLAGDGIIPPQQSLTLDLDRPVTRAEAAVVLYRFSSKYHSAGR